MQIPSMMFAIAPPQKGQALQYAELPTPQPGPDDVLIRVRAAGVNRAELLQREGNYPPPPGASLIMGLEAAGEIAATGANVKRWKAGDPVCALLAGGGYAQYCVAHEGSVLPKPDVLDYAQAACVPEAAFTVWTTVFSDGALKPGERFLMHGGASGIGTTAIQIAKAWGAEVYATAGSADKVALCERLGARGINYREEDFAALCKEIGGVDVILDMVGAPYFSKNLLSLRTLGRLVNIAFQHGSKVEGDLMRLMLKRLTITGSTLRSRSNAEKAQIAADVESRIWPMIDSGAYRPVMDSSFKLQDVESALKRLSDGVNLGKVALLVD